MSRKGEGAKAAGAWRWPERRVVPAQGSGPRWRRPGREGRPRQSDLWCMAFGRFMLRLRRRMNHQHGQAPGRWRGCQAQRAIERRVSNRRHGVVARRSRAGLRGHGGCRRRWHPAHLAGAAAQTLHGLLRVHHGRRDGHAHRHHEPRQNEAGNEAGGAQGVQHGADYLLRSSEPRGWTAVSAAWARPSCRPDTQNACKPNGSAEKQIHLQFLIYMLIYSK